MKAAIAISDGLLELIRKEFFVEERFLKNNGNGWYEVKRRIQPREMRSHFKGSYWIGWISRETPVNWLCFDLDAHDQIAKQTLIRRKDKLFDKFGDPHLISSSPSGGIHMYYFLDSPIEPTQIQSEIRQSVRLSRGEIELFPGCNGLRLFGGKNCILLNRDLKPIAKSSDEIQNYFIGVCDFAKRASLTDFKRGKEPIICAPAAFEEEAQDLINNGLQAPSTRNEKFLKLSRYLQRYRGYDAEETAHFLINWIAKKNNGFSKDWLQRPGWVKRNAFDLAQKTKVIYCGNGSERSFPIQILDSNNIKKIEKTALRIEKETSLELFKVQAFLVDFTSYCKANHSNFVVPIPRSVFRACKYGSGTRYKIIKDKLLEIGIISLKLNYSASRHKCCKYSILEEFLV